MITEQEIKAKRKAVDQVIDDHECGYCHYPNSACQYLRGHKHCGHMGEHTRCYKSKLSSLGVVLAVEGEIQGQHIDNPFLGKLVITTEDAIVGCRRTVPLCRKKE